MTRDQLIALAIKEPDHAPIVHEIRRQNAFELGRSMRKELQKYNNPFDTEKQYKYLLWYKVLHYTFYGCDDYTTMNELFIRFVRR